MRLYMFCIVVKFQIPSFYTFWYMNFFLGWIFVKWQTDRQTDRQRCIWAHHAKAQVGWKNISNPVQNFRKHRNFSQIESTYIHFPNVFHHNFPFSKVGRFGVLINRGIKTSSMFNMLSLAVSESTSHYN